jgi:hypothetical protein
MASVVASVTPRVTGATRIAVAQMRSTNVAEDNLATVQRLVRRAAEAGCSLVSFPECFEWIGSGPDESLAFAQPVSGALFSRYRSLARESSIWISYVRVRAHPSTRSHHSVPAQSASDAWSFAGEFTATICKQRRVIALCCDLSIIQFFVFFCSRMQQCCCTNESCACSSSRAWR